MLKWAMNVKRNDGTLEIETWSNEQRHRTLKDAIGMKVGEPLGQDHPMLPWIVEHAGTVITRYRVGKDGRTAYKIRKEKPYKRKLPRWGEAFLYLTVAESKRRRKLRTGGKLAFS